MNRRASLDALLRTWSSRAGNGSLLLFFAALLVRGGFALWLPDGILWIDGERYMRIAESLLAGQGFGTLAMNRIAVPTQPLLIALFLALFDGSYTMLRMGFAVIGAATCVVVDRLGREVFDSGTGFLAGWTLALYPLHAYASALFEVPQTFFLLASSGAFWCLFRFRRRRRNRDLLGAGLLFGLSALSVPTVLVYLPLVLVWLAVLASGKAARMAAIAAFSLGIVTALSPWAIRNYMAYGHLILVNAAGGENFWKGNTQTYFEHGKRAATLPCEAGTEGGPYCADLARVQAEAARLGLSENEAILYVDRAGWREGGAYIRQHPVRFVQLFGRKLLALFSPRPDAVSAQASRGASLQLAVSVLTYGPILVLGLFGIVQTRRRWPELFPVYAYLASLAVVYSLFLPATRYRLPIDCFLILFAAHWLTCRLHRKPSNPHAAAARGRLPRRVVRAVSTIGRSDQQPVDARQRLPQKGAGDQLPEEYAEHVREHVERIG